MVPIRFALRNRWWTLAWAIGIFAAAISTVGSLDTHGAHGAAGASTSGTSASPADDQVANAALALGVIK